MSPLILWALNATGLLARLVQTNATDELKAEVEALLAQFNASLPAKPDGSAWTDEDLQALKAEHDALTGVIRHRHDG